MIKETLDKVKKSLKHIPLTPILFAAFFGLLGYYFLSSTSAAPLSNSNLPVVKNLCIYPGYGNSRGLVRHESIENQLGRKITYANSFAAMDSWGGVSSTTWGQFIDNSALFVNRKDVTPVFSFPLRTSTERFEVNKPGGPEKIRQGLFDTANGVNDNSIREIGQRLVASGHGDAILRVGGEPEIDFNPYSFLKGNEDAYIAAFRRAVEVLRAVPGNNFKMDYNGNGDFHRQYTSPRTGITQTLGQAAYPGNAWVDIVSVDIYDRNPWSTSLEKLNHALNLAKKQGKPFAVPEWGLWTVEGTNGGDDPTFIENMYNYLNALPASGPGSLVYHCYFYDYVKSNLDNYPKSKAKFIELFKQNGSAPAPAPTPTPTPEPTPTPQPEQLPNVVLVPGSLTMSPANPEEGQEVSFSVTIRNDGAAATPSGVIHGVSFWLNNNQVIAWSDNSVASLAPGQTRTLTSNGGFDGNATWTAVAGEHTLLAKWDDVNPERIKESDSDKSIIQRQITVSAKPSAPTPTPTPTPEPTPPSEPLVDAVAPTVSIVSPSNNATVANTVTIAANASDNVGVTRVSFYLDGSTVPFSTDSSAPYSVNWNSANVSNGNHTIRASAIDAAGNVANSSSITINVNNVIPDTTAPSTTITTPTNNATVKGTIIIEADATDNVGVSKVQLLIDGKTVATDITAPYRYSLNTVNLSEGIHELTTLAFDASGNSKYSQIVRITVDNIVPPTPVCEDSNANNTGQSLPCTYDPAPSQPSPATPGDINGDNKIDRNDLRTVLFYYNTSVAKNTKGDLNGDGRVNRNDLRILLYYFVRSFR